MARHRYRIAIARHRRPADGNADREIRDVKRAKWNNTHLPGVPGTRIARRASTL
jgi:hypothetical protein